MPKFRISWIETLEMEVEAKNAYEASIVLGTHCAAQSNRMRRAVVEVGLTEETTPCEHCIEDAPKLVEAARQRRIKREQERSQKKRTNRIEVED